MLEVGGLRFAAKRKECTFCEACQYGNVWLYAVEVELTVCNLRIRCSNDTIVNCVVYEVVVIKPVEWIHTSTLIDGLIVFFLPRPRISRYRVSFPKAASASCQSFS